MKSIKYLLFSLFLLIPFSVNADSISNIDMDIVLDKNGTAIITETWKANVSKGTEGWHPYYNLEDSTIKVLSASMDEKNYNVVNDWNENSSLENKAYKAGLYKPNEDETDIVFGVSTYGNHTYKVVYEITNFVKNTTDSDIIYWQLFPYDFSKEPDNVSIKISGYYEYPDDLDVWGYGMSGAPCYVKDGAIYMTSDGPISSSDYLTLLAKFPKGKFTTTSNLGENFDCYKDLADEGAEVYVDDSNKSSILDTIFSIFTYTIVPIVIIVVGLVASKGVKYGYINNKVIDKKNTPMFRDIPCNKDIYYANALINLNNFGYKEGNILGAIILKWVREKKIVFIKPKEGIFNSNTGSIDLTKDNTFDDDLEKELFDLMRAASGDGILEAKELEKWCRKNYQKFLSVFEKIKNNEITKLKNDGHIYIRKNKEECKYKNVMDDKIYEDSKQLFGLKLYLQEFSRIGTKEVMEVQIWDEYLMFAYLFGIADKVAKQLKNLYPDSLTKFNNDDIYFDYGTLLFINTISTSSVNAASAARSAAESYSAGGGGFSSGGGGGGSFGGGGGGGGFR